MNYRYKIGFIGSGNMAKAIADGILRANMLTPDQIIMTASQKKAPYRGIEITDDNRYAASQSEYLILAVKPQIYAEIKDQTADARAAHIVSIMAGINRAQLKATFVDKEVFRVMPNTPCAVGKGMCVIADNGIRSEGETYLKQILSQVGDVMLLDEKLFDAMTSVSGSGPAYVYYFIDAMIQGGIAGGLSEREAKTLTLATFEGAVAMVRASDEPIGTLIERVCSKGGTTIQAIDTFRTEKLDDVVALGMERCRKRSEELGKA